MKMKNGGFSLIEMVIAVALVGVLSTLVVPKVREQLAKGKDAKAVAILTALRTASELYYVENEKSALEEAESEESIKKAMENLLPYLDSKAEAELKDGKVEIGGSKAGETEEEVKKAEIKYGGEVTFTFTNPEAASKVKGDGVYIWFKPLGDVGQYDTTGKKKWIEY